MRVIIAGSRTITRIADVIDAIHKSDFCISCVINGCCPSGVDDNARWLAVAYLGVPVEDYPADWGSHGLAGGPIRNRLMAERAEALILVWDGKSRGSLSMLNHAKSHNLKIYQHIIK